MDRRKRARRKTADIKNRVKEHRTALMTLWTGGYCMGLLLKLKAVYLLPLLLWLTIMLAGHIRLFQNSRRNLQIFDEICLYLDTLLHAFQKERKIHAAFSDTAASMRESRIGPVLQEAISRMEQAGEGQELLAVGLDCVEEHFPCQRVRTAHRFMLQAEYYGGNVELPIRLLLQDKQAWEKRIQRNQEERKRMYRQIAMSVAASLLICSAILYLPIMNMDISGNPLVQCMTVLVILIDERILYKAGRYLEVDYLQLDKAEDESLYAARMEEFSAGESKQEKRRSMLLSLPTEVLLVFALWKGMKWAGALLLCLLLLFSNQHRIGAKIAEKKLKQHLRCVFPLWLLDIGLLLQTENVQVALMKSEQNAPAAIRNELRRLLAGLEAAPEAAWPYYDFLKQFDLPEIRRTMGILYAFSNGTGVTDSMQLEALLEEHLRLQDAADAQHMTDSAGNMYLLFLAPVLTASVKLVADMTVFLLQFLGTSFL